MLNKTLLLLLLTLLGTSALRAQLQGVQTYDLRDGTAIAAGQTEDGAVAFTGTYSHHGDQYGLNMKADGTITVAVTGSSTVRFLGSRFSGLLMTGTAAEDGDLGTHDTQVENDLADTYVFTYSGPATTLSFTLEAGSGNDLYLPVIEVIPAQAGMSFAAPEEDVIYYFDLRDGSIIPTDTDGQSGITSGLFEIIVGCCNAYGYNGGQHGSVLKTGNQILLDVAGNTRIRIGGSQFSNGTISVSSETGAFDVTSQPSMTQGNFGNDGATVDFTYVGDAGAVVLDFENTNYIPYIELVPIPFEVTLTPWVAKSGTITINGTEISLQSGASGEENATVTLSEGTVISTTGETSSVLIDLAGQELSSYPVAYAGDIDTVTASGDSLLITFADAENSDPVSFIISVTDNSITAEAEPGQTYTYNFYDGSELPQISYQTLRYPLFVSGDGLLTINSNTIEPAQQFGYHDATHGGVFFSGNSFDIIVAGQAIITFIVDQYGSAVDAVFEFTGPDGEALGSIAAQNIEAGVDAFPSSFAYNGPAGTLTATLVSGEFPTSEIYLHGLTVENAAAPVASNGKADVWDFGAEQLDTAEYNNWLTVEVINAWYDPSITVGSTNNVLPSFSEGALSWVGGGNDRLRSTNEALTRYDDNISNSLGTSGRVYVNAAGAVGRYMSLSLNADDEVTLITKTDAGGTLNFQYVPDPESQTDMLEMTSDPIEVTFVAQRAGIYHLFDSEGKPSYFRIVRRGADYVEVTGSVDLSSAADIPAGYQLVFTNEAGKSFTTTVSNGNYAIDLPAGYSYQLSLEGADRYFVSSRDTINVTEENSELDVVIGSAVLFTASGEILGLGDQLSQLMLSITTTEDRTYVPTAEIDRENGTYSVLLEPEVAYLLSAEGVNDFLIVNDTIRLGNADDDDVDIVFAPKPVYTVAIDAPTLTENQMMEVVLTFSNLNEEGYTYEFTGTDSVQLRSGIYHVSASDLDLYPVALARTSNLVVAGTDTTKTLNFVPVTKWTFDDRDIEQGDQAYRGLLFSGNIRSEANRGHLFGGNGTTIRIPVNPGDEVKLSYYFAANFSIEGGDPITTNSGSTSLRESVTYAYAGDTSGYVTVTMAGEVTTYFFEIETYQREVYREQVTVGTDKEFQFINEALAAIRRMDRAEGQRVTILVDPGNYEEMLDIDMPEVTLKNAALTPSIGLLSEGVDIDENAVRVTAYYGHGYDYFSMANNQRWSEDALRVNRENGYPSYENVGAGTTNNSYWNTTVLVTADGFEAEDIIFENSFNQYISRKESEDIVVEWEAGSRGTRPTDFRSTEVQDRSYVERAAAIAIARGADKMILNKCRVIGRQDAFFGGHDSRVVMYRGSAMGAVDYIFGGMTAVFYKTELAMNTSPASSDQTYITAAQQRGQRGYLMYECTVTSAIPGTETASPTRSKPGYFGRPWEATTSEVVFYNTTIETSDFPSTTGRSLIEPLGWRNTLGGESSKMYEYGTIEESGVDNSDERAEWATLLTQPQLSDGTDITPFNFTKGNDDWDPLPGLIESDPVSTRYPIPVSAVELSAAGQTVQVRNVTSPTSIRVYNLAGMLIKSLESDTNIDFSLKNGMWIVVADAADGRKVAKLFTHR